MEGPTRAGVRAGLCLQGHGWQQADSEADALIAEGLHLMGAKRPTWSAGQPEYTIGRDYCANCRGPLDDESIANHERFCSQECRTAMQTFRNENFWNETTKAARWAYELTRREGVEERDCRWCGTRFKPITSIAETCSRSCTANLRAAREGRSIPDRECPGCGNIFRPPNRKVKFCTQACHNFYVMKSLPKRVCHECKEEFQPTKTYAKYCSKKCSKKGYERDVAASLPEKPCAHCGQIFQPAKSKQEYCSRTCASRARVARTSSAFTCEEVKQAA